MSIRTLSIEPIYFFCGTVLRLLCKNNGAHRFRMFNAWIKNRRLGTAFYRPLHSSNPLGYYITSLSLEIYLYLVYLYLVWILWWFFFFFFSVVGYRIVFSVFVFASEINNVDINILPDFKTGNELCRRFEMAINHSERFKGFFFGFFLVHLIFVNPSLNPWMIKPCPKISAPRWKTRKQVIME